MVGVRVGGGPCDNQRVCYHGGRHCYRKVIACVLPAVSFCSLSETAKLIGKTSVVALGGDEVAGYDCVMR